MNSITIEGTIYQVIDISIEGSGLSLIIKDDKNYILKDLFEKELDVYRTSLYYEPNRFQLVIDNIFYIVELRDYIEVSDTLNIEFKIKGVTK